MSEPSPRWSITTKRTVALVILVLVALILYRFRAIVQPLAIALFLAFIVEPAVTFLVKRLSDLSDCSSDYCDSVAGGACPGRSSRGPRHCGVFDTAGDQEYPT